MASSGEREHNAGVSEAASPEPSVAPDRLGLPGARSEADIQRTLARGDPRVRAALARSLQGTAGNQAVQRLAMESRRLQRFKDTDRTGDWRAVTGGNALGKIADTGETLTFSTHEAYATAELIEKSNGMLAIKDSGVHLYATEATKTVVAPDGSQKTLRGIGVNIKTSPTNNTLSGDCREAALDVAGKGPSGGPEKLIIKEGGQRVEIEGEKGDASDAAVRALLIDKKVHETPNYASLDPAAREKLHKEATKDVETMKRVEREAIRATAVGDERAKEIGIDHYANPGVGDAYTVVTAPTPMPNQYRFHFAAVIMAPGNDRVTLENEGESPGTRNEKWKIETYSVSEQRKTFHAEHPSLTRPGHTFVVRTGPPPPDDAAKIIRMTTPDLVRRYVTSNSRDDKQYIEKELFKRTINVVVAVDSTDDSSEDEVYAVVSNSSKSAKTGKFTLKRTEKGVLKVPLQELWPLDKQLEVKVFEWDLIGDDHIGTITWPQPYEATKEVPISARTASYRVALDIM
jgi:hypothetical protein